MTRHRERDAQDTRDDEGPLRLLLAVHTRELRTALFLALADRPAVQIVATATNSAEFLTYARALRPEIVVLELELPGTSLNEVLQSLTASDPPARLLVLGRASSPSLVGEADCGAQFVHDPAEILAALDGGAA